MEQATPQLQHERAAVHDATIETRRAAVRDRPDARLTGWSIPGSTGRPLDADDLDGDLLIVHGYPGSGKSHLVAALGSILAGASERDGVSDRSGGRLAWRTDEGAWSVERPSPFVAPAVRAPRIGRVAKGDAGLAALLGTPGALTALRIWRWDGDRALSSPLIRGLLAERSGSASSGEDSPRARAAAELGEATVALELAQIELDNLELELRRYTVVPPMSDIETAEHTIARLHEALSLLPLTQREVETAANVVARASGIDDKAPERRRSIVAIVQPVALFVTAVLVAATIGLLAASASTNAALAGLAALLAGAVALISPPRPLRVDRESREAERKLHELKAAEGRWRQDLDGLESRIGALARTVHLPDLPDRAAVVKRTEDVAAYRAARERADALAVEANETKHRREALTRRHALAHSRVALVEALVRDGERVHQLADQLLDFASEGTLTNIRLADGQVALATPDGRWHLATSRRPAERNLADLCLRVAAAVSGLAGIAPLFPLIVEDLVLDPDEALDRGAVQVLSWVTARLQVVAVTADERTTELLAAQPCAAVTLLPRPAALGAGSG